MNPPTFFFLNNILAVLGRCISTYILGQACQCLQKKKKKDGLAFVQNCVGFIDQFGTCQHIYNIKSSNL